MEARQDDRGEGPRAEKEAEATGEHCQSQEGEEGLSVPRDEMQWNQPTVTSRRVPACSSVWPAPGGGGPMKGFLGGLAAVTVQSMRVRALGLVGKICF